MSGPVDPGPEDVRRFMEDDDGGPVVMLNLLKYGGTGGKASYERYAAAVVEHLERVGGEVVYSGATGPAMVAPDGHDYDAVLVVRYPSRQKFLEMVLDPGYQAITHLRSEGLEHAVLQPTAPGL